MPRTASHPVPSRPRLTHFTQRKRTSRYPPLVPYPQRRIQCRYYALTPLLYFAFCAHKSHTIAHPLLPPPHPSTSSFLSCSLSILPLLASVRTPLLPNARPFPFYPLPASIRPAPPFMVPILCPKFRFSPHTTRTGFSCLHRAFYDAQVPAAGVILRITPPSLLSLTSIRSLFYFPFPPHNKPSLRRFRHLDVSPPHPHIPYALPLHAISHHTHPLPPVRHSASLPSILFPPLTSRAESHPISSTPRSPALIPLYARALTVILYIPSAPPPHNI
ncbi:hypothetical protein C8J57DRAFT_1522143 [Mycena rebaudengoi]|nr:hypothetical protein C8J57DRAFT_1522143 [Mycena rebaudengoi]